MLLMLIFKRAASRQGGGYQSVASLQVQMLMIDTDGKNIRI